MGNRYSRTEIDRIISEGSIKQKSRLFLRDRMGYFGQGFILSYGDIEALTLSVDAVHRKEWEGNVSMGLRIENGFRDLSRFLNNLMTEKDNLSRTLTELMEFEKYEVIINKLLLSYDYGDATLDEIVNVSREKVKTRQISTKDFVLTRPYLSESGTMNLGLTGANSLTEKVKEGQRLVLYYLKYYLCYEEAMRQRISEFRINIPEYMDKIKENRVEVEKPTSMSIRFVGVQDNRGFQIGECNLKDKTPKEYPNPSLRDLIEDYSVRVQDIDLTTAECQKQIKEYYNSI